MTNETRENVALVDAMEKPILRICTGSRMYGTAREDDNGNIVSDLDLRDVVIPPYEFLTTIRQDFETRKGSIGEDHVSYSFDFFVKKLLSANAQFLELLFAPKESIIIQTETGKELLEMRDSFVSKKFYHSLKGFSYSEYRKACGQKLKFEKETPTEQQTWDTFREVFAPKWGEQKKEIVDGIKALAYSCHEITLVPSTDGITKKRRDEFDRFGYCSSSACHSLRLIRQTTELLRTGTMTFPCPDAIQLRDIKMGRSTLEEFQKLYDEAQTDCDDAFKTTKLPDKADKQRVMEWYKKQVTKAIGNDERFRVSAGL